MICLGYATPYLKNKAILVSNIDLYYNANTYNNGTGVYVQELTGVVSEALLTPSSLRLQAEFNNQVDFYVAVNGVVVWSIVNNYGGFTTVTQDITFNGHLPGESVVVAHRRNGAGFSTFRNFRIMGTSTPIALS